MTACREILELMSTSLDQVLSPAEQAKVDRHLAGCQECRAAWKEIQWTHSQIKGLEAVEPPPWLASKTMARIRAEAVPEASFWRRFIRPIMLKPQLQVASVLLLAATGFYLLRSQRSEHDVFSEMKQRQAPASAPSQPAKSLEARDKILLESGNEPRELRKSSPAGMNQGLLADSKASESGFAPSPPPTPTETPKSEMAKAERDRERLEPPAAAPSAPSSSAGAFIGGGTPVLAESGEPSGRQVKKISKGSDRPARADHVDDGGEQKRKESSAQLMDQAERKDKSDATILLIRLEMADPRTAKPLIEQELVRNGASLMPQHEHDGSRILRARLDAHRLPELISKLARIGRVLEQPGNLGEKSSVITISISW